MSKVQDTLDLSLSRIMSMSRKELAKQVGVLASAGNKRLARFKKKGITTPSTAYIKKHGGKFSTRGKDVKELREEFQRAKGFLESETSTIKGYRQWENKVADTLKSSSGIDYNSLTESQKRKFWKAYSKLEELDQANVYSANYRGSVNAIYEAVKGGLKLKDIDAFVTQLDSDIYRNSARGFLSGVNNPFEL